MKNNLKYIKNIFKVLFWPIVFTIGSFFINYIFVAIFNSKEKGSMNNDQFLEHIKTLDYQERLNNFINSKTLIIILITTLIFMPILYKVYKRYKKENNFKFKNITIPIILGVAISLIYNIIIFYLNKFLNFTNNFEISSIPIIVQIISTGILGPVLEEFIFRGIVYNKLKTFNKRYIAIILTSVIFALFHTDIVNAIYGFIVSFVLIYIYEKYKSLKAPILTHIFLNTTIILILPLIIKNYIIFNLYLLLISVLILFVLKINLEEK